MKIYKNKNGITLIALVITIVIMLLLAAIVIQLTLGENGLISKANQAKIEQEKSELYDDAKLEYLNLKTKAIENNQPDPKSESILSEINFLNKYNIIGDNITNKKSEIIETKKNLLKEIEKLRTNPDTNTVADEDKNKLVLRLNIKNTTNLELIQFGVGAPIKAEFHDGSTGEIKYEGYYCPSITKTYTPGTYILKLFAENPLNNLNGLEVKINNSFASVDIINWGKIKNLLSLYMPLIKLIHLNLIYYLLDTIQLFLIKYQKTYLLINNTLLLWEVLIIVIT